MALNSGLAPNTVKTALDKVFFKEFDYSNSPGLARATDSDVFKQDTTDRAAVISEQFQGTGYFQTRAESSDVPSATARVGNQVTSSVLNYANSIDLSKNFFDDNQWSVVDRNISDMGRLARLTQDKNALAVYNNGFTTETANDGVALFSNSHITLNGTTVDNLETGVLSETNLHTLIVSMRNQKTQDGTLGLHQPTTLILPNQLHKSGMEITKSVLRQGTANNDLNYYSEMYPGLQVKYSPFLDTVSTTAYFLLSRNHGIYRFVRQGIQTSMVSWEYTRNNNYVYKAEYREVVDAILWEGSVGSNGTV